MAATIVALATTGCEGDDPAFSVNPRAFGDVQLGTTVTVGAVPGNPVDLEFRSECSNAPPRPELRGASGSTPST